jgi:hypothetical protein
MQQASTYQRDPTDVVGNPSNPLQTNDVAHGETSLDAHGSERAASIPQARHGQNDSILLFLTLWCLRKSRNSGAPSAPLAVNQSENTSRRTFSLALARLTNNGENRILMSPLTSALQLHTLN